MERAEIMNIIFFFKENLKQKIWLVILDKQILKVKTHCCKNNDLGS